MMLSSKPVEGKAEAKGIPVYSSTQRECYLLTEVKG